ncbi:MAG: hypothetical protein ACERKD_09215 [Prolixibacteraceae bacterium]
MTNQSINFKRERDFGDLFNATFSFIGHEFKRLGTSVLYFVLPLLLLSAISSTIYSVKLQETMQNMVSSAGDPDPFAMFTAMASISSYVFFNIILSLLATTMMLCTVYCYIKMYIHKGSAGFTVNDVWREVMKNFGRLLIASVLIGLLVGVGFVFCILPGIYLGVALSIIFPILILEEINFSDAFSRSFKLMKSNWWMTFGVFIVAGIMIYILSILLAVPSMIMGFKSMFFNIKQAQNVGMNFSIEFYVVTALTNLISQFFTIIPIVLTAFIYYSLVEKHEKPSLIEKIGQMNENE